MTGPASSVDGRRAGRRRAGFVFLVVLAAQLLLVAGAGTDIPFQDQWDVEGRRLFPAWQSGEFRPAALFEPHNEHRIFWTRILDLGLFALNRQWDPLVELAAGAVLRAAVAALLAWVLTSAAGRTGRILGAAGVAVAFLPHLAWQNALWGFQSQVYFSAGFAVGAFAVLGQREPTTAQRCAGHALAAASMFAMGAGFLVPVALLGLAALHAVEGRSWREVVRTEAIPALVLLLLAGSLRTEATEHDVLRSATAGQFFSTAGRALAWPHSAMPLAALVLNLPLAAAVIGRLARRRTAAAGEDRILLIGGWVVALAGAMAWTRGGGGEFAAGVPSRYVDFLVLAPLANAWCLAVLLREANERKRAVRRAAAASWGVFLLVGWLGLSAEVMRGLVRPRWRDRDVPVRLAVEFRRTGDEEVFRGQPLLYVPHPTPGVVREVLRDPRLKGALPPSFQPGQPVGPLSRVVRAGLRR